jgi:general secretion pathway protein A
MYDQFYGLTGRPFQLTPDPQFYFESATHRKALSYLGYGLAQGEGFIVITGEVGAGKSTLVSHLMQSVDKSRLTAATIVTSQLDGLDMVHMAAESFGIDTRGLDKASTLKSIENFLHAEARTGRRCLLVVDEAQNLSVDALEELRMLSNFQLGSMALLQIFLLGQPEFRDLVRDTPALEQLRQRIIATHHLDAMDSNEVEPYIVHRLSRVGWNGRPQILPDAFTTLYAQTGGVPRKLNTLMNRVMLMGAVEQVDVVDSPLVKAVVADMAGKPFEYEAPMSARASAKANEEVIEEIDGHPAIETVTAAPPELETEAEQIVPLAVTRAVETEKITPFAATQSVAAPAEELEALASRISTLEQRVSEQDAALRRTLAMMIDWMDKEASIEARFVQNSRAA